MEIVENGGGGPDLSSEASGGFPINASPLYLSSSIRSLNPKSTSRSTMHRRTSRKSDAAAASYLRYLKPGALAQLRDSRISARTHRVCASQLQISFPLRSPSSPAHVLPADAFPCSPVRIRGPRCPQRKKLVAAKAMFFSVPVPSSPVSQPHESVVDLFSNSESVLVAH
nr:Peptidyl-prolyl cis-trans isomerase [Ipomoea batatas]